MRVQVEGHIKIGEAVKGIPSQWKKMKLTELFKGSNNTFETYRNSKSEGYEDITVKLPFIGNVKNNFNLRELSFVKINNFYKYIAFVVDDNVYLEPYAPNFGNPMEDLPIIKLGTVDKWAKNLLLEIKAIGYFIPIVDGKELGIFDFKTSSAHSMESLRGNFEALGELPMELLMNAEFKLKIIRRVFESKKNDEVSYLDFILPSYSDLISKSHTVEMNGKKYSKIRKQMEDKMFLSDKEKTSKSISYEEAIKYFTKFEITIDKKEQSAFVGSQNFTQGEDAGMNAMASTKNEKSEVEKFVDSDQPLEEKKTNREILRENKGKITLLREKGVDLKLSRQLILKLGGDKALEKAEEAKYNSKELARLI